MSAKDAPAATPSAGAERTRGTPAVQELPIEEELRDSYLTYAMSVIVARALPDVRDGLKPSQRRLLVAMNDLNLSPGGRHRKCAKICGDTSGNYHPHGEQVIYPTLVRMAQGFNMRHVLVDGQGNFGSIDGYRAAAMRYTEARLSRAAAEMLEDIDAETVDSVPSYDETRTEPVVLPSKFPNLLVNGSQGIAVGMATSIPPHNLGDIAAAIVHLIENPGCTVDELMERVPGPDFPTGGIICGRAGIRRTYRTGRGRIIVRARVEVEEARGERKNLIVTEIPFQVQKRALIERMAEAVKAGSVTGVSDIVDESDRQGMRIVVRLSPGADENVVLNQLWKRTQLQDTFSANVIALVDARPETLNLKRLLEAYRDHRFEVITRRTRHRLRLADERRHDLEGLLVAVANLDDVVELIRSSPDTETARGRLIERFRLSRRQAEVILNMRLGRLTGLEREKLQAEYDRIREEIGDYRAILADPARVLDIVKEDVYELRDRHADRRRTEITDEVVELSSEDLVAVEAMAVTLSREGYLKRMRLSTYRRQRRGGRGVIGATTRESDFTEHLAVGSTHDVLLFFSDAGRVFWQKMYDLPLMGRTASGRPIATVLRLREGERVTSMLAVSDFASGTLAMATELGRVKRTELGEFANPRPSGLIAIKLEEGNRLVGVERVEDDDELVLATANGRAVRFSASDVRPMGRASAGVTGVKLRAGDRVVALVRADPLLGLVTISARGYAKRTPVGEYRLMRRGGQGVANMAVSPRTGEVVACLAAAEEDEVLVMTAGGLVVRTDVSGIREMGRNVKGVRVMKIGADDRVIAAARLEAEPEEPEEDLVGEDDEAMEETVDGEMVDGETVDGDEPGEYTEEGEGDDDADGPGEFDE